jgi:hypothetical protein
MNHYETNIFPIENCEELSADYRLFEIVNLLNTSDEYEQNIQYIIKKLSYSLSHPVTIIPKIAGGKEKDFLVIKDDIETAKKIPKVFHIKKGEEIYFVTTNETLSLSFTNYDNSSKEICRRFLQFSLNNNIGGKMGLWSPGSGKPYFSKQRTEIVNNIEIFNGFLPRIVELPTKGWGVEIGITKKYASATPVNPYITREEFDEICKKGKDKCHFIYHYGNNWYEIRIEEYSEQNASQHHYIRQSDGKRVTVMQDLRDLFNGHNMPPEIANLPDDVSLLIYRNNNKEIRRIPAALCYRVYDTDEIGKLHEKSIADPFLRRRLTYIINKKYFQQIRFGKTYLKISEKPLNQEIKIFDFPDQKFGNNTIISTKRTQGTIPVDIYSLGVKRKDLLNSTNVGVYDTRPFETQYFLMPESVSNSFGHTFLKDLKAVVERMHPTTKGWNLKLITYDDRNYKKSVDLAIEIMGKVNTLNETGFAVVMIPSRNNNKRQHDDLAAICVSQCAERAIPIKVSIMHTETLKKCFNQYSENEGYSISNDKMGLYKGYLRGVALNKVLLNNGRSPFVLANPLHGDLIIGIDVKKSVAGYIFIDKKTENIRPHREKSKNKEQLSTAQVLKVFVENIKAFAKYSIIEKIVVHRDGRVFKSELIGMKKALETLKERGILPPSATLTIVEIPKYSVISLRLFEIKNEYDVISTTTDNYNVSNPKIGSWMEFNENEGFVATTGREFKHRGSSKPLYIKRAFGDISIKNLLQDIYWLSTLAHTKPDDCSRNPLTISLADRLINDFGGGFDEEEYALQESLKEEEI